MKLIAWFTATAVAVLDPDDGVIEYIDEKELLSLVDMIENAHINFMDEVYLGSLKEVIVTCKDLYCISRGIYKDGYWYDLGHVSGYTEFSQDFNRMAIDLYFNKTYVKIEDGQMELKRQNGGTTFVNGVEMKLGDWVRRFRL